MTLLAQIINGISSGATYAIVAAGLALTVGVLRVVNFAHGDLFMIGSYLFWFLYVQASLTYWSALSLTIPAMAVVGVVFFFVIVRPILDKAWQVQLIATLAASTILNNAVIWLIGSVPQSTPTAWSQTSVSVLRHTDVGTADRHRLGSTTYLHWPARVSSLLPNGNGDEGGIAEP